MFNRAVGWSVGQLVRLTNACLVWLSESYDDGDDLQRFEQRGKVKIFLTFFNFFEILNVENSLKKL